jgi:hypothetical protein
VEILAALAPFDPFYRSEGLVTQAFAVEAAFRGEGRQRPKINRCYSSVSAAWLPSHAKDVNVTLPRMSIIAIVGNDTVKL